MPAGRPTKYSKAMQEKADAYLNGAYIERGDGVPSVAGLARFLGVTRSTMYEWRDAHCQFSDTLGEIDEEQHRVALGKGIMGEYNSTICKLVLANHGYSERVDQQLTSPDGSMGNVHVYLPQKDG